ncbi:hypothetical protein [Methylomonas albis]|uniref:Right handed beta helix domain-containing protein n=1 Tax=Methylomonas albis TaxID=1854563 RepID=A0ABR9D5Z9_9GAMM|nr:hypothetical protein [Methylomonas albis]MBD9358360.1 hypothetical protein [Methylomonas albis]CAD6881753.1 hypothetical protein [Methylomonas albis]
MLNYYSSRNKTSVSLWKTPHIILKFIFLFCCLANIQLAFSLPNQPPDPVPDPTPNGNLVDECVNYAKTSASLTLTPQNISFGDSVNLSWHIEYPSKCNEVFSSVELAGKPVGLDGDQVIKPMSTRTYSLSISTPNKNYYLLSQEVEVTLPNTVHIDGSNDDWKGVLIQALQAGNKKIVLASDVDMDLTGIESINIKSGTTLTSEMPEPAIYKAFVPAKTSSKKANVKFSNLLSNAVDNVYRPPARNADNLGPRLYLINTGVSRNPLFIINDSNVKISGFRLQGPNPEIGNGNSNKEIGIKILPVVKDGDPLQGIEISQMEIYNWSGAGVEVNDTNTTDHPGRLTFNNASGVYIHDNYIHHNRHHSGFGYGVSVGEGGYALIAQNVFEQNRHAIAGESKSDDGTDFSGYIARNNLILPGGGAHCTENSIVDNNGPNICWRTHQIDMHGDISRQSDYDSGTAGETMIIEQNTILYTGGPRHHIYDLDQWDPSQTLLGPWENGNAIKIRGNPKDKVYINANVFAHSNRADAIVQNYTATGYYYPPRGVPQLILKISNPITVTPNNLWGAKPLKNLVKCDFTGDGLPDDFMATGVTWWVRSAVTQQWQYLNTKTERLNQLIIQDLDNDGICDVARKPGNPLAIPRIYSKSGKGDWVDRFMVAQ